MELSGKDDEAAAATARYLMECPKSGSGKSDGFSPLRFRSKGVDRSNG